MILSDHAGYFGHFEKEQKEEIIKMLFFSSYVAANAQQNFVQLSFSRKIFTLRSPI